MSAVIGGRTADVHSGAAEPFLRRWREIGADMTVSQKNFLGAIFCHDFLDLGGGTITQSNIKLLTTQQEKIRASISLLEPDDARSLQQFWYDIAMNLPALCCGNEQYLAKEGGFAAVKQLICHIGNTAEPRTLTDRLACILKGED